LKPPTKENVDEEKALISSLQDLMKNDESARKEYKCLDTARVVQYNISYGDAVQTQSLSNNVEKDILSINNKVLPQQVKEDEILIRSSYHKFSLSTSKQDSYVEPILAHVERALFRFLVRNEDYIPSNIVKEFATKCNPPRNTDFSDANILCILNFIINHISLFIIPHTDQTLFHREFKLKPLEVIKSFKNEARNHHAHGITQYEGKWCDEKLQRLSTLALELVECLGKFVVHIIHVSFVQYFKSIFMCKFIEIVGDESAFEELLKIKQNLSSELTEYALSKKRKSDTNDQFHDRKKRTSDDEELGKLTDFALDIIKKVKSDNQDHLNKIIRLAVEKNESFLNIWKSLITREDEDSKIQKFICSMNICFDMVNISKIYRECLV
ncbi:7569_t:CDS:2, partial [Gigaspora rosea]